MKSEQLSKLKQVLQRKGVTDQGPGGPATKLEKSLQKRRKKSKKKDEPVMPPTKIFGGS
jgi:hypothetical protein